MPDAGEEITTKRRRKYEFLSVGGLVGAIGVVLLFQLLDHPAIDVAVVHEWRAGRDPGEQVRDEVDDRQDEGKLDQSPDEHARHGRSPLAPRFAGVSHGASKLCHEIRRASPRRT